MRVVGEPAVAMKEPAGEVGSGAHVYHLMRKNYKLKMRQVSELRGLSLPRETGRAARGRLGRGQGGGGSRAQWLTGRPRARQWFTLSCGILPMGFLFEFCLPFGIALLWSSLSHLAKINGETCCRLPPATSPLPAAQPRFRRRSRRCTRSYLHWLVHVEVRGARHHGLDGLSGRQSQLHPVHPGRRIPRALHQLHGQDALDPRHGCAFRPIPTPSAVAVCRRRCAEHSVILKTKRARFSHWNRRSRSSSRSR